MSQSSFSTSFTVDSTPAEVVAAISDPRAWWMTDIVGSTERVGDEFGFEVPGVHWSRLRVTELAAGELVVWRVVDGKVGFVADHDEWTGTEIRFDVTRVGAGTEVRFTHVGLRPDMECYEACSGAWTLYAAGSLRDLLTTGAGAPGSNPDEKTFAERAGTPRRRCRVSGFQTYLDNAEARSGVTPRAFMEMASERGLADAKVGAIVSWLKTEHGLGHGHANNLAQLISKGPDVVAEKYNDGVPLRLDGGG